MANHGPVSGLNATVSYAASNSGMFYISGSTTATGISIDNNHQLNRDIIFSGPSSLEKRMEAIEARLCILAPNLEKMENFPALKKAYEHYLLIEKLCFSNDGPPNEK